MTKEQIAHAIQMLQHLAASVEAKPQVFSNIKQSLVKKDKQILKGFARMKIRDVVLMDRSDRSKAFNVKPYKAWIAEGRVVRKGQHGVKGLFHVSQTEPLAPVEKTVIVEPKAQATEAKPQESQLLRPNKAGKLTVVKSLADLAKLIPVE